jgi:hypothetical protein
VQAAHPLSSSCDHPTITSQAHPPPSGWAFSALTRPLHFLPLLLVPQCPALILVPPGSFSWLHTSSLCCQSRDFHLASLVQMCGGAKCVLHLPLPLLPPRLRPIWLLRQGFIKVTRRPVDPELWSGWVADLRSGAVQSWGCPQEGRAGVQMGEPLAEEISLGGQSPRQQASS